MALRTTLAGWLLLVVIALAGTVGLAGARDRAVSRPHLCPQTNRQTTAVGQALASGRLVPMHATRLTVCRYRFQQLAGSHVIAHEPSIASLGRQLDALRSPPTGGSWSCPGDDGTVLTASFEYRGLVDDVVVMDATGCQLVSNGTVQRWARYTPGPKLIDRLVLLTGCRHLWRKPGCP